MATLEREILKSPPALGQTGKWAYGWSLTQVARVLRRAVPLGMRRKMVKHLGRRKWPGQHIFSIELLRDFAENDSNNFHRFLWANHLAYAQNYEISRQFGIANVHASRQIFFAEVESYLRSQRILPERDVSSVFEVGCSLGYLLRFAEMNVFRSAQVLKGLDIDGYAVDTGSSYLRQLGSKVELVAGDMLDLDRVMGDQVYDIVLCCGVLMYLEEALAARVIESMLRHSRVALALMGLAHQREDNSRLPHSGIRENDEAFIHNLDCMVQRAGGKVVLHRWEGSRLVEGNSIYIVLAEPAQNRPAAAK